MYTTTGGTTQIYMQVSKCFPYLLYFIVCVMWMFGCYSFFFRFVLLVLSDDTWNRITIPNRPRTVVYKVCVWYIHFVIFFVFVIFVLRVCVYMSKFDRYRGTAMWFIRYAWNAYMKSSEFIVILVAVVVSLAIVCVYDVCVCALNQFGFIAS